MGIITRMVGLLACHGVALAKTDAAAFAVFEA